ncbi:MAG: hypothetical protein ACMUIG_01880 [Thermoplasmatota archaeon]
MVDSRQKDGDRDDPLLLLDQFMDFLKKNTMQLTVPSIEKINSDIGEIERMGRKAESLDSLKVSDPDRDGSGRPDRRKAPVLKRKKLTNGENKKGAGPGENSVPLNDRKMGKGADRDRTREPDRAVIPGLDFINSLIPDLSIRRDHESGGGSDPETGADPNSRNGAGTIPDRKKIINEVDEIEMIADQLEKILNEGETGRSDEKSDLVGSRERFILSLKRAIPPIFGSLALMAYGIVVLRVLFGMDIPRIFNVVADPNYIFFGILILLIITLIVNSMRRYRIHMKVRRMRLEKEVPGGEAS